MPSDDGYDASGHLSWGDVLVDDLAHPSRIEVRIKASKTDPFRQGISILLAEWHPISVQWLPCWLTWWCEAKVLDLFSDSLMASL